MTCRSDRIRTDHTLTLMPSDRRAALDGSTRLSPRSREHSPGPVPLPRGHHHHQNVGGVCLSEGLCGARHRPDRLGHATGDVDPGDLRAALGAKPAGGAVVAASVEPPSSRRWMSRRWMSRRCRDRSSPACNMVARPLLVVSFRWQPRCHRGRPLFMPFEYGTVVDRSHSYSNLDDVRRRLACGLPRVI